MTVCFCWFVFEKFEKFRQKKYHLQRAKKFQRNLVVGRNHFSFFVRQFLSLWKTGLSLLKSREKRKYFRNANMVILTQGSSFLLEFFENVNFIFADFWNNDWWSLEKSWYFQILWTFHTRPFAEPWVEWYKTLNFDTKTDSYPTFSRRNNFGAKNELVYFVESRTLFNSSWLRDSRSP